MPRTITFANAIHEALDIALGIDKNVIKFGLGVDDPKGVFGTTTNLHKKYGSDRVFDMPTSENAMTGIAIGAAINGIRPIMTHQRLDFFLLAMDQLVNNAAKWYFMFGGKNSVPITIRLIIGHGWGQGPTHSQNLQAWFAHIPGLKVVMPTTAADAKGLLLSSIFDENPVVFLEHRWLHNLEGEVPTGDFRLPLGKSHLIRTGKDLTVVSLSYMTIEAIHALDFLKEYDITADLIDLKTIRPLDWSPILESVKKTGRLLVLDTGAEFGSISGEIIAKIASDLFPYLKAAPRRVAQPDMASPTSFALTKAYYRRSEDIALAITEMLNMKIDLNRIKEMRTYPHDVPGDWFKGPF